MAKKIEARRLGDLVKITSGGTPSKEIKTNWGGDMPWISASSMKQKSLNNSALKLTEQGIENGGRLAETGDVLLLVRGSELHNSIPVGIATRRVAYNQDIKSLRCSSSICSEFLYYWLKAMESDLLNKVESTGIGAGKIDTEILKGLKILLPGREHQAAIASQFKALDDKIELNRKMNETLEQMARALFKSWFVDFDPVQAKAAGRQPAGMDKATADLFPDSFVETEIGDIPRGWTLRLFSEIADIDKGLSYKGEGLADEGGLPMINLGCFTGRGIFNSERIKRYTGEYRERHLIKEGDLVIANTDMTQKRTIIGSPAIIPKLEGESKILFTHHTFVARFKPGYEIWRQYVFFTLLKPEFREIAEGFSTGTTVLALPRDGLSKYRFCLPNESLLEKFSIQISPILSAIEANKRQSRSLGATRDTLLPKLLAIAT